MFQKKGKNVKYYLLTIIKNIYKYHQRDKAKQGENWKREGSKTRNLVNIFTLLKL